MHFLPHEPASVRTLQAMPVAVRRKLAEVGVELGDVQWRGLPLVARRRLLEMPAETPLERVAFGQLVHWLKRTFLAIDGPVHVSGDTLHPWRADTPPPTIQMHPAAWCGLGIDTRFALVTAESEQDRQRILATLTGSVGST